MTIGMNFAGGAVQRQHLNPHRDYLLGLQGRENPLHYTAFRPTVEFLVYGRPIAVFFRQRLPFTAVLGLYKMASMKTRLLVFTFSR